MPDITRSVESLYSCQLTSENWWKNDWWGCPASHLAMQHLRASSSLKQMTRYFFSYVKQLPLYTNTTSTTDFEGKKEAEKKEQRSGGIGRKNIYYWLLYNDLPTKNSSLQTRSCRGIWTTIWSALKWRRSGCSLPCPHWQLYPFHWSYWQLLERRPWTNHRPEGHCTETGILAEIWSSQWKQLLWETNCSYYNLHHGIM